LIFFSTVFYVDPFQIYHKPFLKNVLLNENQRYQNAGLINSYLNNSDEGYDAAAFGTSASVNFTSDAIAKTLGWKKTMRLFLPGGSPAEIRETVSSALATGKVKHILLEMDLWSMNGEYRPADNASFPRYLYNTNRLDDIRYIANLSVFWESLKLVFGLNESRNGTPEMLGYWADGYWVKEQHEGLNNKDHLAALEDSRLSLTPWSEEKIQTLKYPALDNEMSPLFQQLCNSDIEVVLFVPPYSGLYFVEKSQDVYSVVYELRHILQAINTCKNIRLHAFDTLPFTVDLNNYKDHRHYLLHVSNRMLEWMAKHEHVLRTDTIQSYEQSWIAKLNQQKLFSTYPAEPKIE